MSRKPHLAEVIGNQKIYYGGCVLRRKDVARLMLDADMDWACIDFFAFGTPSLPDETPLTPREHVVALLELRTA